MSKQPLLIFSLSFISGIFFQDFFAFEKQKIYALLLVALLLVIFSLFRNFYLHRLRAVFVAVFCFAMAVFWHNFKNQPPVLPTLKNKELVVFKINAKLNSKEKTRRYQITAWKNEQKFEAVLSVPKNLTAFDFTHYYRAEVYVNRIEKPYSDFQFDYARYLARRGIFFQLYVPNEVTVSKRNDVALGEKIKQIRLTILTKIDAAKLSSKTREFTKGIVLADRTEMDKEMIQDFSKSGLMHILAISGTHMAIIFWLILIMLRPIFPANFRKLKLVIALLLIWSFAIFIDYGSSVLRSCIMISCYYFYVLLQRKSDLLHSMSLAALLILLYNPNQLYDIGFQLSFIAVFGIYWLNQPILKWFPPTRNKIKNFLFNVVSISIAAQIATLPLVIFYFHQWSFISIIANFVIIPLAEILIIFALLMTVLIACSLQFDLLNLVYDHVISWTLQRIHFFAEIEFAFQKMIPFTLLEVVSAFFIVYFLRFVLLKFTLKSGAQLIFFLILFVSVRSLLNYQANGMDEILEHRFFNEKLVSVKSKDRVQFLYAENSDLEKLRTYVIEPYLTSRRTQFVELVPLPKDKKWVRINNKIFEIHGPK